MRPLKELIEEAFRLTREGKYEQAENAYEALLCQLDQGDPNVLFGYASLLAQNGKYGLAITLFKGTLALCDTFAPVWNNLAAAYRMSGQKDKSLGCLQRSLELDPNMAETLASLAGHYLNSDQAVLAEEYARRALAVEDISGAHMHLGMALLEQGRFAEAWPHYEGRWGSLDNIKNVRAYKAPRWDGSKVRKLAIHGEQGLGDEILFMSLFRKASELSDEIVVECAPRLIKLFEHSFDVDCYGTHAELIAAEGEPDAYNPMGSLPLVLGLPDGKPYLEADGWRHLKSHKPIIGIAWKGGTPRTNREDRSLTLEDFKPIMDSIDAQFVSVQYGGEDIEAECNAIGLVNFPRDFDHLTSTIAGCDLVISVCQTAIHQAGALGVPVWVLAPRHAPWVCCGEDLRPWYNSGRIFRQEVCGEWESVIRDVCAQLQGMKFRAAA